VKQENFTYRPTTSVKTNVTLTP